MTLRVFRFGFVNGADALRATPVEAGSVSALRASHEPSSGLLSLTNFSPEPGSSDERSEDREPASRVSPQASARGEEKPSLELGSWAAIGGPEPASMPVRRSRSSGIKTLSHTPHSALSGEILTRKP